MNADSEVFEHDRAHMITRKDWKSMPDVQNLRKSNSLYQSHSHKMKTLHLNSAAYHNGTDNQGPLQVNPIWMTFKTKCVKQITSAEEMRKKLDYYSHSPDVMLVRYHQNNCTACNAVDKSYEYLCHEIVKTLPNIHFYEISKETTPELTRGLVRFPQIKGFSGGQWTDLTFKPADHFRESLFIRVEAEVQAQQEKGTPVSALQAEEMYFSAAGPAMATVLDDSIHQYYTGCQVRLHNYWKQVSVRRSWFYKKFVEPNIDTEYDAAPGTHSVFGEKAVLTAEPMPNDFN